MAPMKVSLSFVAVFLSVLAQHAGGFVVPVGSRGRGARSIAGRSAISTNKDLSNRVEARPQGMHDVWRHQASLSASRRDEGSSAGSGLAPRDEPPSRLSRISRRVRKMVRKAIMGYLPEEEVSYSEAREKAKAAAAALRGEAVKLADERLRGDATKAKQAAADLVEEAMESEEEDMDIFSSDFVRLDVGDQSPMEAEDVMASLRRRLEQGVAPDAEGEQGIASSAEGELAELAERKRLSRLQQQKKSSERPSRPASFDGDTAVAELPSPNARTQPSGEGEATPKVAPKLASSEDVERLNRMFGSMGGEPLP